MLTLIISTVYIAFSYYTLYLNSNQNPNLMLSQQARSFGIFFLGGGGAGVEAVQVPGLLAQEEPKLVAVWLAYKKSFEEPVGCCTCVACTERDDVIAGAVCCLA